ncbi:hypothetical protein ACO0LL_05745 [Undibacterium sp. TC4M20W]|uniref:hypothetical protein n=1 Tax=Undibacterium sp. TC4M20W TaxID=3413052 RepID=UPI003BF39030
MTTQFWDITYTNREGESDTIRIENTGEPTPNDAALKIRTKLLGETYLLPDMPRGQENPTLFTLQSYGYNITKIAKVTET